MMTVRFYSKADDKIVEQSGVEVLGQTNEKRGNNWRRVWEMLIMDADGYARRVTLPVKDYELFRVNAEA